MPRLITATVLAAAFIGAGAGWTAPLTAMSPIEPDRMVGRWYEILRTPNTLEKNCYGAYQEWTRNGDAFAVQQVCHRDSPTGRVSTMGVKARPVTPDNTEFEAIFFGGLIHARYVLTDHAPDYSWLIATTMDGRYPKLLARTPGLPPAEQDALKQRMARLGFDIGRLEAVGAPMS